MLNATLSFAGDLKKNVSVGLAGLLTSMGQTTITAGRQIAFAADLVFSGALTKRIGKGLAASFWLSSSGGNPAHPGMTFNVGKGTAGTLDTSGNPFKERPTTLAGTLSFAGALSTARRVVQALSGTLTFAGSLFTVLTTPAQFMVRLVLHAVHRVQIVLHDYQPWK